MAQGVPKVDPPEPADPPFEDLLKKLNELRNGIRSLKSELLVDPNTPATVGIVKMLHAINAADAIAIFNYLKFEDDVYENMKFFLKTTAGDGADPVISLGLLSFYEKALKCRHAHGVAFLDGVKKELCFWFKLLEPKLFGSDQEARRMAIKVFQAIQDVTHGVDISNHPSWLSIMDDINRQIGIISDLLRSNGQDADWSGLWCILVVLMGREILVSKECLVLFNSLLKILGNVFRGQQLHYTPMASNGFRCWQVLIDLFFQHRPQLREKHYKLLMNLMKSRPRVDSPALIKLKARTWWCFLHYLDPETDLFRSTATDFLDFCCSTVVREDPAFCTEAVALILGEHASPASTHKYELAKPVFGACLPNRDHFLQLYLKLFAFYECLLEALPFERLNSPDGLSDLVASSWTRLLNHVSDVIRMQTANSHSTDVVKALLITIGRVGYYEGMDERSRRVGLLITIPAVLEGENSISDDILTSSKYYSGEGLMMGTPALYLTKLLLTNHLYETNLRQEEYLGVINLLIHLSISSSLTAVEYVEKTMDILAERARTWNGTNAVLSTYRMNVVLEVWRFIAINLNEALKTGVMIVENSTRDLGWLYTVVCFPVANYVDTPGSLAEPCVEFLREILDQVHGSTKNVQLEPNEVCESLSAVLSSLLDERADRLVGVANAMRQIVCSSTVVAHKSGDALGRTLDLLSKVADHLESSRLEPRSYLNVATYLCNTVWAIARGWPDTDASFLRLVPVVKTLYDFRGNRDASYEKLFLTLCRQLWNTYLVKRHSQPSSTPEVKQAVGDLVIMVKELMAKGDTVDHPDAEVVDDFENTPAMTMYYIMPLIGEEQYLNPRRRILATQNNANAQLVPANGRRIVPKLVGPRGAVYEQPRVAQYAVAPPPREELTEDRKEDDDVVCLTDPEVKSRPFATIGAIKREDAAKTSGFPAPKMATGRLLTKHQREVMRRRRDDIPAMYGDLTQDTQSDTQFGESSSTQEVATAPERFSGTKGVPADNAQDSNIAQDAFERAAEDLQLDLARPFGVIFQGADQKQKPTLPVAPKTIFNPSKVEKLSPIQLKWVHPGKKTESPEIRPQTSPVKCYPPKANAACKTSPENVKTSTSPSTPTATNKPTDNVVGIVTTSKPTPAVNVVAPSKPAVVSNGPKATKVSTLVITRTAKKPAVVSNCPKVAKPPTVVNNSGPSKSPVVSTDPKIIKVTTMVNDVSSSKTPGLSTDPKITKVAIVVNDASPTKSPVPSTAPKVTKTPSVVNNASPSKPAVVSTDTKITKVATVVTDVSPSKTPVVSSGPKVGRTPVVVNNATPSKAAVVSTDPKVTKVATVITDVSPSKTPVLSSGLKVGKPPAVVINATPSKPAVVSNSPKLIKTPTVVNNTSPSKTPVLSTDPKITKVAIVVNDATPSKPAIVSTVPMITKVAAVVTDASPIKTPVLSTAPVIHKSAVVVAMPGKTSRKSAALVNVKTPSLPNETANKAVTVEVPAPKTIVAETNVLVTKRLPAPEHITQVEVKNNSGVKCTSTFKTPEIRGVTESEKEKTTRTNMELIPSDLIRVCTTQVVCTEDVDRPANYVSDSQDFVDSSQESIRSVKITLEKLPYIPPGGNAVIAREGLLSRGPEEGSPIRIHRQAPVIPDRSSTVRKVLQLDQDPKNEAGRRSSARAAVKRPHADQTETATPQRRENGSADVASTDLTPIKLKSNVVEAVDALKRSKKDPSINVTPDSSPSVPPVEPPKLSVKKRKMDSSNDNVTPVKLAKTTTEVRANPLVEIISMCRQREGEASQVRRVHLSPATCKSNNVREAHDVRCEEKEESQVVEDSVEDPDVILIESSPEGTGAPENQVAITARQLRELRNLKIDFAPSALHMPKKRRRKTELLDSEASDTESVDSVDSQKRVSTRRSKNKLESDQADTQKKKTNIEKVNRRSAKTTKSSAVETEDVKATEEVPTVGKRPQTARKSLKTDSPPRVNLPQAETPAVVCPEVEAKEEKPPLETPAEVSSPPKDEDCTPTVSQDIILKSCTVLAVEDVKTDETLSPAKSRENRADFVWVNDKTAKSDVPIEKSESGTETATPLRVRSANPRLHRRHHAKHTSRSQNIIRLGNAKLEENRTLASEETAGDKTPAPPAGMTIDYENCVETTTDSNGTNVTRPWVKGVWSPCLLPERPILKIASPVIAERRRSLKRVNFPGEFVVTKELVFMKAKRSSLGNPLEVVQRLKASIIEEKAKILAAKQAELEMETEDSQSTQEFLTPEPLSLPRPELLDDQEAFYPPLVDCDKPVNDVTQFMVTPTFRNSIRLTLKEEMIETVGDFCRLTEKKVSRLPLKEPKIETARKTLKKFNKCLLEAERMDRERGYVPPNELELALVDRTPKEVAEALQNVPNSNDHLNYIFERMSRAQRLQGVDHTYLIKHILRMCDANEIFEALAADNKKKGTSFLDAVMTYVSNSNEDIRELVACGIREMKGEDFVSVLVDSEKLDMLDETSEGKVMSYVLRKKDVKEVLEEMKRTGRFKDATSFLVENVEAEDVLAQMGGLGRLCGVDTGLLCARLAQGEVLAYAVKENTPQDVCERLPLGDVLKFVGEKASGAEIMGLVTGEGEIARYVVDNEKPAVVLRELKRSGGGGTIAEFAVENEEPEAILKMVKAREGGMGACTKFAVDNEEPEAILKMVKAREGGMGACTKFVVDNERSEEVLGLVASNLSDDAHADAINSLLTGYCDKFGLERYFEICQQHFKNTVMGCVKGSAKQPPNGK